MQKVNLIINLQNEQISIRNTREIHEIGKNSKNKHFKVTLSTDWSFLQFLTDSQPFDIRSTSDIKYKGLNHAEMSLNHFMQQQDGLNETMNHDILPLIKIKGWFYRHMHGTD